MDPAHDAQTLTLSSRGPTGEPLGAAFMPRESNVQTACLQLLRIAGLFHWRNNTGVAMLPGRGGRPRPVFFGVRGSPDILAVFRGRAIGIECKAPGRHQSEDQRLWQSDFEKAGGWYLVVHDSQRLEDFLKQIGAMQ